MAKPSVADLLRALEHALGEEASPERAVQQKRYLKSELHFLGASVPAIRRQAKAFVREHSKLSNAELRTLCEACWATRVHELRSVAIGVLEQSLAKLSEKDVRWILPFVRDAHTWAHVDWLAIKVIGPLLTANPQAQKQIDKLAQDQDFWVRRTALLCWHDPLIRGQGDFDHFARLTVPMLHEKEFFIRKAIGWVLRSTAKRRPERTIAFVTQHARALSALSFHEATRNLPAALQKKLRALRMRTTP